MAVNTYSAAKVDVIVAGVPLHGFSEDSVVTVAYASDQFTFVTGADGETGRSFNPDRSGTITISLMSYSDSNDFLSALAIADAQSLTGTFPVLVKDGNGTSIASSATAWVQKVPDAEFGREITTREWVLQCAELVHFAGGNF